MSKESDEERKLRFDLFIKCDNMQKHVESVSYGFRNGWDTALAYAAKQQAERDARINKVLEKIGHTIDGIYLNALKLSDHGIVLKEIRDIMEGKS